MSYQNILLEQKEGIATITFNRPTVMNALSSALLDEFENALDEIAKDDTVRAVILTGAGEKAFVAGADIKELASLNALQAKLHIKRGNDIILKIETLPQAVIAGVNGFALGGGAEIALACDFIYASEAAKFGLPEITLGIIPGYGGTQRLPRLIGKNRAKEMIYTGKMISATAAKELGMVNKVVAPESLMEETLKTARMIATKGRVAIRGAKQSINTGFDTDLATGIAIENNHFALTIASKDAKEGLNAFLEKRKPVFNGSLFE